MEFEETIKENKEYWMNRNKKDAWKLLKRDKSGKGSDSSLSISH